jgi:hypothetical protein
VAAEIAALRVCGLGCGWIGGCRFVHGGTPFECQWSVVSCQLSGGAVAPPPYLSPKVLRLKVLGMTKSLVGLDEWLKAKGPAAGLSLFL